MYVSVVVLNFNQTSLRTDKRRIETLLSG